MITAAVPLRFAASLVIALGYGALAAGDARAQAAGTTSPATGTQTGTHVGVPAASTPAATGTQPGAPTATHAGAPAASTPAATGTQTGMHAGAPAAQEDVRRLFEQGVAAHDSGKLELAEGLFSRAWAQKRSWDIAANLGIVLRKRGEHLRAAELLRFALVALPPSEAEGTRAALARELDAVMPSVARVTVRSNVAGATVRVAGHPRGSTPLDAPVLIAPGIVLVEVQKQGHEPALEYVRADAGASVEVTVTLSERPERALSAPLVAFGFGAAGLLTGAVATGIAAAKLSELEAVCGGDLVCPPGAQARANEGRTAGDVATAGFVLAGLGAAVGLTLLALPAPKPAPRDVSQSLRARVPPSSPGDVRQSHAGDVRRSLPRDFGQSLPRMGLVVGPAFVGLKGAF